MKLKKMINKLNFSCLDYANLCKRQEKFIKVWVKTSLNIKAKPETIIKNTFGDKKIVNLKVPPK